MSDRTVLLDDFITLVAPFARGASEPAIVNEVRQAAIEFCKATKVWQQILEPPLDVVEGEQDVELILPDEAELVDVRQVFYHRTPLDAKDEDSLYEEGIRPGQRGTPRVYTFTDEFVLKLAPIPMKTESEALHVRVSLHPTQDCERVPDTLLRRYGREIAEGAIARLLEYDEEWARRARKQAGTDYRTRFEIAKDMVRSKVAKSNVRGRRRVIAAYF